MDVGNLPYCPARLQAFLSAEEPCSILQSSTNPTLQEIQCTATIYRKRTWSFRIFATPAEERLLYCSTLLFTCGRVSLHGDRKLRCCECRNSQGIVKASPVTFRSTTDLLVVNSAKVLYTIYVLQNPRTAPHQ